MTTLYIVNAVYLLIIVLGIFSFLWWILHLKEDKNSLESELKVALDNYSMSLDNYSKLLGQKKSSEVRLGKMAENMAPFFKEWPYDPNNFRFLGNPVDGIQFDNDAITFVEIKTGKARLVASQKKVKELVTNGKVKFVTFRIDENGCTLKAED